MPLPEFDGRTQRYTMSKKEIIAWMKEHGYVFGDEKLVQHVVEFPQQGPFAGQIIMTELTYVPNKLRCPNVNHTSSDWIFLTLMPTGVYLSCAHRKCRITCKVPRDSPLILRKPPVIITVEEAKRIFAQEKQFGLGLAITEWLERHPEYESSED